MTRRFSDVNPDRGRRSPIGLDVIEYLKEENRVLREQLGARRLSFTDDQRRRLAAKAKALCRESLREIADLVTPDTLLRWYRELIAAKYDGSHRRGPGRPRVMETIRELVLTMAKENSSWGYTRICGALANMGHEVGRNTVKRILAEHGIEPAPARDKRTPWSTFVKAHWGAIAATNFFTVEVLTAHGLFDISCFSLSTSKPVASRSRASSISPTRIG